MTRQNSNPDKPASTKADDQAKTASAKAGDKARSKDSLRFRISELAGRKSTPFTLEPDAEARAALAQELGLLSLPRLRFEGRLEPKGRRDWELSAKLGATVVQPCVVTLEPVKTRLDETVERLYSADFIEPEGDEVEMPEDDRLEPLPDVIDIGAVMAESLSLALPLYPRSDKAPVVDEVQAIPPGAEPIAEEEVKPFAALKSLRDQLFGSQDGGSDAPEGEAKGKDKGQKLH